MPTTTKGRLIRADEVGSILGVSTKVAADLMKQMPRMNVGRSAKNPRWVVYEADVDAYLQSRLVQPEAPEPRRGRRRPATMGSMEGLLDERGHIVRRK